MVSQDEYGHDWRNAVADSGKGDLPKGDNLKQNHLPVQEAINSDHRSS
jgi:hypothetical protein